MDEQNTPIGYFATLDTATISMHEMFVSLVKAGFTENQALKLVLGLVSN